jgi:hypothetical protein
MSFATEPFSFILDQNPGLHKQELTQYQKTRDVNHSQAKQLPALQIRRALHNINMPYRMQ